MDKVAFDALYREHYRRVLGLCRRILGGTVDAEDATQEVFMRGYRSFGRYRSQDPFGPWINTIASNYCIDVLRGNRRVRDLFDTDAEPDETESVLDNGAATLIREADSEAVNQAVEALPEQYRLPIVLAYYSDASYDEIADTPGITRNHVGVLLLRGKKKLRQQIANATGQEN